MTAESDLLAAGRAYRARQATLRAQRSAAMRQRREQRPYIEALRYDPCAYCGSIGGVVDHIVPRSRGGANAPENYCGVCKSCNTAKGTRTLLAHLLIRRIDDALRPTLAQRSRALRL